MACSISVDMGGRVTGICPDNLTGGSGWIWAETGLTPQTELFDARGAALYKVVDGTVMPRTQEERDADTPEPEESTPTPDERMDQVEAALLELAAIVAGGD